MKYKVIKSYGIFKKGDILEWDADVEAFTLDVTDGNTFRSAMIDSISANLLLEEGVLSFFEEVDANEALGKAVDDLTKRIVNTYAFIDDLRKSYENDWNTVLKGYEAGEVQPCVKVEAETVFYNLQKVLKSIREKLDEQVG